jgi:hypothetical protein
MPGAISPAGASGALLAGSIPVRLRHLYQRLLPAKVGVGGPAISEVVHEFTMYIDIHHEADPDIPR